MPSRASLAGLPFLNLFQTQFTRKSHHWRNWFQQVFLFLTVLLRHLLAVFRLIYNHLNLLFEDLRQFLVASATNSKVTLSVIKDLIAWQTAWCITDITDVVDISHFFCNELVTDWTPKFGCWNGATFYTKLLITFPTDWPYESFFFT